MTHKLFAALAACLIAGCLAAHGDTIPFGAQNAHNQAALEISCSNPALDEAILFDGHQGRDGNNDTDQRSFTYTGAAMEPFDGQFGAPSPAPSAVLGDRALWGGDFIGSQIGHTDENDNHEWVGVVSFFDAQPADQLAATPEPETLTLMGSGFLLMTGLLLWSKRESRASKLQQQVP